MVHKPPLHVHVHTCTCTLYMYSVLIQYMYIPVHFTLCMYMHTCACGHQAHVGIRRMWASGACVCMWLTYLAPLHVACGALVYVFLGFLGQVGANWRLGKHDLLQLAIRTHNLYKEKVPFITKLLIENIFRPHAWHKTCIVQCRIVHLFCSAKLLFFFHSPSFEKWKLSTRSESIKVGVVCVPDVKMKIKPMKIDFSPKARKIWTHETNSLYGNSMI